MRVPAAIPYQSECSRRKRCERVVALLTLLGCGGGISDAQAHQLRSRLRATMGEPVATREQRDDHSRALVEVADSGVLEGLNQEQLRAEIGRGQACRAEICDQNGFQESDWYYEIGVAEGDEVKQLPVLIIGFDPRGRAARIWTLKTH